MMILSFLLVMQTFAEEFPSHLDWQTYCTWVTVMNKVTSLSLYELTSQKKIVDCTQALFRYLLEIMLSIQMSNRRLKKIYKDKLG